MVVFSRVNAANIEAAFEWFCQFAEKNSAIFKRDATWFERTVEDGAVWSASENGRILGLVYTYYDATDNTWELGGLMVSDEARGRGIGLALMRIALAHMLFEQDPLSTQGTRIIAHVLKSNQAPRGLLELMGFHVTKEIEEHVSKLEGLKAAADPDDYIRGDELDLDLTTGLTSLAKWLLQWDGSLLGGSSGEIRTRRERVDHRLWGEAIEEMAARFR